MEGRGGDLAAQLRRDCLLDMETRIKLVRRRAFIVLALALITSGPWIGPWFLIPLAASLVGSLVADRLVQTRPHPHRWAAVGWGISGVMITGSVALTGAADSPAMMWMALPAITLGARFELGGVILGVAYLVALMLLSTVALDVQAALDRPDYLIFAIALVIATDRRSRIRDEIERTRDLVGVTGVFNMSPDDHVGLDESSVTMIEVEDGEFVPARD